MSTRRALLRTGAVLALVAAFATARAQDGGAPATDPAATAPTSPPAGYATPPEGSASLQIRHDPLHEEGVRLGRAALEQAAGNTHALIGQLEHIDFSREPRFPEADRAAFLLGQAYLRAGSVDRFSRLAGRVAKWRTQTVYTKWIAFQQRLAETRGTAPPPPGTPSAEFVGPLMPDTAVAAIQPIGMDAADVLAASLLLREGNAPAALGLLEKIQAKGELGALVAHLRIVASGQEDSTSLARLADSDTATALGRDLAGAALVRTAVQFIGRNADPAPILERVSPRSRYFGRARHVQGLYAMERGSAEGGRHILESLYAEDSSYVGRRDVGMALAGQALTRGEWADALRLYQEVDRDWGDQRDALAGILQEGQLEPLWESWEAGGPLSDVLTLDGAPAELLASHLATASADLGNRPGGEGPDLGAPEAGPSLRWPIAPPPPSMLREVARSGARLGDAVYERDATHRAVAEERASLADLRRYLELGVRHAAAEQDTLRRRASRLDSLAALLDRLDARLRDVRDEAKRRIVARATVVRTIAERQLAWVRAMRRFHMEGPYLRWPVVAPAGYPSPDSLTKAEESLARAIHDAAQAAMKDTPDLIDRSYQHAWRPGLIDRTQTTRAEAWRQLSWVERISPAIQRTLAGSGTSPRLEELLALESQMSRRADTLRIAHGALRERVAREAIASAMEAIQAEREGIDYGLAASAYALSVGLAPDSTMASAAPDTSADDPESARKRREAIASLEGFLAKHPESAARGEMRFRLADLLLVDERQTFRGQMARYLAEQSAGRNPGAPPVLSYAAAYKLYRAILDEDRDYPHRDAVLFNTGMILADEGNPEAERWFQELVTNTPDSRYAQESWARMGDQHFNDKDFAACIPLYEKAAQGADPTLRAISLYKLGWARFNGEQFFEAATAFQAVIDVYDSTRSQKIEVDIAGEAEQYLVHSLARAGGATAFAKHFGESRKNPFERRVLRGLGAHYRRYSLHAEAAETEKLYLERYPNDPEALGSAERLADTYERWNRPELARQARLDNAARFAPRSAWADAQESDSLRQAGAQFSKSSWTTVARHHHFLAREKGAAEDWREAQRLYGQVLTWWPQDAEAPLYELYSGEASAHLNDYEGARAHYARAAASGADSVASEAMWQRVAVTDAWYEKSRASQGGKTGLATDTLARAVIQSAEELTTRYPAHPHAADAIWRTAHLSLAHGWYDRAATDFGALATRHPNDRRAPAAGVLQADALFQVGRFEDAGRAYEAALVSARAARADSLAKKAEAAIPVCAYRLAEASVAADSSAHVRHAELFEQVAARWPKYEHAHLAQYRAGLAYAKAGKSSQSVAAMQKLIDAFPKSEYVKDAHLQIARTWETSSQAAKAGEAYARFAERYPSDSSAAGATLKGADLLASGGQETRADTLRLAYVRKYPGDVETAMEVYEALARRDLKQVSAQRPVSALLAPGRGEPVRNKKGKLVPGKPTPNPSFLAEYLRRAEKHPKLASQPLVAEVRFHQGEEAYASYDSVRLKQPLDKTIALRQKRLDSLLVAYRRSADVGVAEWSRASAYRIGQALVGFGAALEQSERPADLRGEDLQGYDDVLKQQAQTFYDRGEGVWSDLLRKGSEAKDDPWVARAQKDLWGRLGTRFYFRPEVDYPVVANAAAPEPVKSGDKKKDKTSKDDPVRQAREQMALSPSPYWPYRLASAHLQAGRTDSAEAALRLSIARDSSYAPALSQLTKIYFETGRHQQAIDLLEAARARSAEMEPALLVGLALHHDAMQQGGQAGGPTASGDKPEKIKGGPGAFLALRGPKPEDATPLAESAVRDQAASAANQNNYGITRLRAADPEGARKALDQAVALNPKLPGPYYNLAILEKYFTLDDDAAAKRFRQYWALSHDDPDRIAEAFDGSSPKNVAEKKD